MKDYGNHVAMILNTAKKEVVNLANEAYKTGYNDCNSNRYIQGYEEAKSEFYDNRYQQGLDDAWIMARKIVCDGVGDYTSEQRREIFGNGSAFAVLKHFTVFDAKKKIEDYEEIKAAQEAAKIIEDEKKSCYECKYYSEAYESCNYNGVKHCVHDEEKQVNELEEIIADLEARHKDENPDNIKCEIIQNDCIYTKDTKVMCSKCPVFNAYWKGRGE